VSPKKAWVRMSVLSLNIDRGYNPTIPTYVDSKMKCAPQLQRGIDIRDRGKETMILQVDPVINAMAFWTRKNNPLGNSTTTSVRNMLLSREVSYVIR
jgi:hypothetical protein